MNPTRKGPFGDFLRKGASWFLAVCLAGSSCAFPANVHAQTLPYLPAPGTAVALSPAFVPAMLRGIKVDLQNPLQLDFIIDSGDARLKDARLEEEGMKMVRYFLASLTTPETDMWVNLSPNEKDRIIPQKFGETEMGRDLLAQDYILKQLTASLLDPQQNLGKDFWERVYKKVYEAYGTTDVPMDTFNKIWIVTDRAVVYENKATHSAFVTDSYLKVMLEEEYLTQSNFPPDKAPPGRGCQGRDCIPTTVLREIILPEIEKEVNIGRTFARLRQMYHAMILATWYKKRLKEGLIGKVYVDKNKTAGVDIDDPEEKRKIYDQYMAAFRKGVYNFIREEYDPHARQIIPRKYFSGGFANRLQERMAITDDAPTDYSMFGEPYQMTVNLLKRAGTLAMAGLLTCAGGGACSTATLSRHYAPPGQEFIARQLAQPYAPKRTNPQFSNLGAWIQFLQSLPENSSPRNSAEFLQKAKAGAAQISQQDDPLWGEEWNKFLIQAEPLFTGIQRKTRELEKAVAPQEREQRLKDLLAEYLKFEAPLQSLNERLLNSRGWEVHMKFAGDMISADVFKLMILHDRRLWRITYLDPVTSDRKTLTIPVWRSTTVNPDTKEEERFHKTGYAHFHSSGAIFLDALAERDFAEFLNKILAPSGEIAKSVNDKWGRDVYVEALRRDGQWDEENNRPKESFHQAFMISTLVFHEAVHAVVHRLTGDQKHGQDMHEGVAYDNEIARGPLAHTRLIRILSDAEEDIVAVKSLGKSQKPTGNAVVDSMLQLPAQMTPGELKNKQKALLALSPFPQLAAKLAEFAGRDDLVTRIMEDFDSTAPKELYDYLMGLSKGDMLQIARKVFEWYRVSLKIPDEWEVQSADGESLAFPELKRPGYESEEMKAVRDKGLIFPEIPMSSFGMLTGPVIEKFHPPQILSQKEVNAVYDLIVNPGVRQSPLNDMARFINEHLLLAVHYGDFRRKKLERFLLQANMPLTVVFPQGREKYWDSIKEKADALTEKLGPVEDIVTRTQQPQIVRQLLLLYLGPMGYRYLVQQSDSPLFREEKLPYEMLFVTEKTLADAREALKAAGATWGARERMEISLDLLRKKLLSLSSRDPQDVQREWQRFVKRKRNAMQVSSNEDEKRQVLDIFALSPETGAALVGEILEVLKGIIADGIVNNPRLQIDMPPGVQSSKASDPAGTTPAVTSAQVQPDTVGGIDFNAENLKLQLEGDPFAVPQPSSLEEFNSPDFDGLFPFLIRTVPMTNLPAFLGLSSKAKENASQVLFSKN